MGWAGKFTAATTALFIVLSFSPHVFGQQESLNSLLEKAKRGDPEVQFNLGHMYNTGRGVAQDYAEAVRWFRKAADQGHTDAQVNLGHMYYTGQGVTGNHDEAARWSRKAADQGNADAQVLLGAMYYTGEGVAQDYTEAYMWLNFAASRAGGSQQSRYADERDRLAKLMIAEQIAEAQRRARVWKPKSSENKVGK